jgi:hypothetical protein
MLQKEFVLVSFVRDDELPLDKLKEEFTLRSQDIDETFGVVALSHPLDDEQLYCALIEAQAAKRIQTMKGVTGVYSDPKITS